MKHPPINNMNTEEEDVYNKALKDSGYALTNREEDIASIFFYAGLNAVLSSTEEEYMAVALVHNPIVNITSEVQTKAPTKLEAIKLCVDLHNKDPKNITVAAYKTSTTKVFEATETEVKQ